MLGGGGNKIVATLRSDCKVYPTTQGGTSIQLVDLRNYKIRADVSKKSTDISNKSFSTLSIPTTNVDLGKQLLQFARDSDLKGVKNALYRGAPFTSDWLGMSALHFAAMNNQMEICKLLLEGGINKDSKTKVDRTPLHLACYSGNKEIVELLLNKNCAIDPKDMLRMTPLHWAIEKRHKDIVMLLLKHNADVDAITKFGRSPLALAISTGQHDLVGVLEAAKQAQANRKYNEQHEKETSAAVNSIMGRTIDLAENTSKIEFNAQDFINPSSFTAAQREDLENINNETGIDGNSTINLLKSHGISMMPEDDSSRDMLNSALQNGRQLILSEGGRLLLNETKKIQTKKNVNVNKKNVNVNNKNVFSQPSRTTVPIRVRNDAAPTHVSANNYTNVNKVKSNVIANNQLNMAKQSNIRLISLDEFKKMYGNIYWKNEPQNPPTVASQNHFVNVRQPIVQQPKQQINIESNNDKSNPLLMPQEPMDVDDSSSNIIEMVTRDNDNDFVEAELQTPRKQPNIVKISINQQLSSQQQQQQQHQTITTITKQPVRFVPAKRVEHMGTLPVRQVTTGKTLKLTPSNIPTISQETKGTTKSSVMPLLSIKEICRQLLELRKQNEELRRKFDLAQTEKEEMRQRIERLEELMLVEKADEDYAN